MIAESLQHHLTAEGSRFEAAITSQGLVKPECTLYFQFNHPISPPESAADPWLASLLIPAMFSGENLEIHAPVSAHLVRTAAEIQRMLHAWYPALLHPIRVTTGPVIASAAHDESGRMASFFSGGVDSWFTLQQHRAELAGLITVKGFDIPCSDRVIWPALMQANQAIARELAKELVTVETNLREHLDPEAGCFKNSCDMDFWGACFHGACLAAAGLFLQEEFATILIPSSWHYSRLHPWGSHPTLDPLWSTGRLEFVHDGAHLSRLQKAGAITSLPLALRHLRVCSSPHTGAYNCGRCEKCRRTMASLRGYGALDLCGAFPAPLDLRAWELEPPSPNLTILYRELLELAEKNSDHALARLFKVFVGDSWSPRLGWHRWSRRMQRSAAKRWNRVIAG